MVIKRNSSSSFKLLAVFVLMAGLWLVACSSTNNARATSTSGTLFAWGNNFRGQLGTTDNNNRITPARVNPPFGFRAVAMAAGGNPYYGSHSLAINSSDGKLYAWGSNFWGQLGTGDTTNRNQPELVAPAAGFSASAVAAGTGHSLALGNNGKLYAWGDNTFGQLGSGSLPYPYPNTPHPVSLPAGVPEGFTFTAISAGSSFNLAIGSDSKLYAWGSNGDGQLGIGPSPYQVNTPQPVKRFDGDQDGFSARAIAAGAYHSLALGTDGKLYAWGDGFDGQLGSGFFANYPRLVNLPAGVAADFSYTAIAAGTRHSLAIGSDGKAYAWGRNYEGQLGNGSSGPDNKSFTPILVNLPAGVSAGKIAAGEFFSLATGTDNKIYAWGDNSSGQLGTGDYSLRNIPWPVNLPAGATPLTIAAGGYHSLAILEVPPQPTSLTVSSAVNFLGGNATLSASLYAGEEPVAGRSISFMLNGTQVGSAITDESGLASLMNVPGAGFILGVYPVVATFAGDSSYLASAGIGTLMVAYKICALYDQTKSHKLGNVIPIKLQLCDAAGNNLSAAGITVTAVGVTLVDTAVTGQLEDTGSANPDNNFRYDPDLKGYIYNLSTRSLSSGTYKLSFMVSRDTYTHTVEFQIK